MKRHLSWLLFLLLSVTSVAARAALKVVATTPDLASVARAVGGAQADVSVLALHTQDPHWVDARPHLALALAHADLLVVTGAELELGWLPTLQTGSHNGAIQRGAPGYLDCSTLVGLLDAPAGSVDRSQGDIHPSGSPHYMLDPRRVERVAIGIGKSLASLDPQHRADYLANTKAFVGRLREARTGWEQKLSKKTGEEVIAYHKSLSYLAEWLGLKVIEHIEPRPGIPPNPRHVAHLVEMAQAHHVRVILQEAWFPAATSQIVADKSGAKLVTFPGMPNFSGGQSYEAFMSDVVNKLAAAL